MKENNVTIPMYFLNLPITGTARKILIFLKYLEDKKNPNYDIGTTKSGISKLLGIDRKNVRIAFNELIHKGYIKEKTKNKNTYVQICWSKIEKEDILPPAPIEDTTETDILEAYIHKKNLSKIDIMTYKSKIKLDLNIKETTINNYLKNI